MCCPHCFKSFPLYSEDDVGRRTSATGTPSTPPQLLERALPGLGAASSGGAARSPGTPLGPPPRGNPQITGAASSGGAARSPGTPLGPPPRSNPQITGGFAAAAELRRLGAASSGGAALIHRSPETPLGPPPRGNPLITGSWPQQQSSGTPDDSDDTMSAWLQDFLARHGDGTESVSGDGTESGDITDERAPKRRRSM